MLDYVVMFVCLAVCAGFGYWRGWRRRGLTMGHELGAYKLALRDRDEQIAYQARLINGRARAERNREKRPVEAFPSSPWDDDYPMGIGA